MSFESEEIAQKVLHEYNGQQIPNAAEVGLYLIKLFCLLFINLIIFVKLRAKNFG